ncbi:matrixin family metalloprotease [Kineosporia babensis]|uniref:Matrixin family metalloprotease n=1 Tax=Kineosporia babensis TaxID=499548 RepID=A0A9X1SS36_9ACTN|nr:matrixin family metalloprotease [Kineosporia babensis]MCD5309866.1 matrixin family metalloprotease [Kineosporia babensis]
MATGAHRRRAGSWLGLTIAAIVAVIAMVAAQLAAERMDQGSSSKSLSKSASSQLKIRNGAGKDTPPLSSPLSLSDPLNLGIGPSFGASGRASQSVSGSSRTISRPSSYALMKVRLNSGKTVNARWNPCQRAITYQVNLSGLPKHKRAAMLRTIKTSFKKLSAATGMTYRYQGTTGFVPRQDNLSWQPAEIVVAAVNKKRTDFPMTDMSLGYGGVLWSTWYGSQGEGAAVMRGYVVLEAKAIQKLKTGFGTGKRQSNVILHELGHASGLNHAGSRRSQMYPTLTDSSPSGFAKGDRAGLAKVGKKSGCIKIPSYVSLIDLN